MSKHLTSASPDRLTSGQGAIGTRRPVAVQMAPLWLVLVGRAAVHRQWPFILSIGLAAAGLGIVVTIDSLSGAVHIPDRWFGILLLIEAVGSVLMGLTAVGAARRLRFLKGGLLGAMGLLIVMATWHSAFLLAMIFGCAFLVDGVVRIVIANVLRFSGWRGSTALGALGAAFGLFHLQPWPTWYAGTVGYCIGMFLILNGIRFTLVGLRARHILPEPTTLPSSEAPADLTIHVWTPTGHATTPARQRLLRRYVASVDALGVYSTGHAALELGDELYLSHYPAVDIDRSPANLRSSLRAGPENDVPGRFLPSYREEVADWCEATVAVTFRGADAARLRAFWAVYRQDSTYNFIGRNCSTAVARALDVAVEGAFSRDGHPWRRLAKALTIPEFWAAALLRNGAGAMTWTPGLVLDYTRALSVLVDPVAPAPGIDWAQVGQRFVRNGRIAAMLRLERIARRRSAPPAGRTEVP